VLVVGAGTSGADIAFELAAGRGVRLSGELPKEIPVNIEGVSGKLAFPVVYAVATRVLNFDTPIGRRALPKMKAGKKPLIRVKREHLSTAGVKIVPRTVGVRDGLPLLKDGRTVNVPTVVWCTGYRNAHDWIDLPVLDEEQDLETDHRGVVEHEPGLYRVGREFLHSFDSHNIGGVGRDAQRIVELIASRN
jgi:putative flavoprotein involved in K+ transport